MPGEGTKIACAILLKSTVFLVNTIAPKYKALFSISKSVINTSEFKAVTAPFKEVNTRCPGCILIIPS